MTKKIFLISAAAAGLMAASFAPAASADGFFSKKCYGIAKAGQNECASVTGVHSCKGQAKIDKDPGDWITGTGESCALSGGSLTPPPPPAKK